MTNTTVTKETDTTTAKKRSTKATSTTKSSSQKTSQRTTEKRDSHSESTNTLQNTQIELYCDRSELEEGLNFVRRGIPQNPHHPLLTNVLIEAHSSHNILELTANSLDFGTNIKVNAKVSRGGRLTLPLEIWENLIKKFPQGQIVIKGTVKTNKDKLESTWHEEGYQIVLSPVGGDAQFELEAARAEEFPHLALAERELLTITAEILLEQLSSALVSVASKQDNRILTGVYFAFAIKSDKLVEINTWSTDGSRLTLTTSVQAASKVKLTTEASFTLSAKVVKELKNSLSATPNQQVRVFYDIRESHGQNSSQSRVVMFTWGERRLVARVQEGEYPDCSAIRNLVGKNDKLAVFDKTSLLKSLERLRVLSEGKHKIVQMSLAGARATFKVQRGGVGKGQETQSVVMSGEPVEVCFNIKNLIDAIDTIESDDICFKLADSHTPCLIEGYGTYQSQAVPVKVEHIVAPLQVK